jgi:hypothetical protein
VVTIDIPGAFLHATNEDYVIMQMNGMLAELITKMDPKPYKKYRINKKGKKVLYICLQKALFGMMKSGLLFYHKLFSELKLMGFKVKPFDPCFVTKVNNCSQMTLQWHHVDDLMISHANAREINEFL